MADPRITIISTSDRIIMEVFCKSSDERVDVQNKINLEEYSGVMEKSFERYSSEINESEFLNQCSLYKWGPPGKKGYINVINYVLIPSDVNTSYAKSFPIYSFSGLPHLVVVNLFDNNGTKVSSTQGEIL